jgi:hypothetical protein
MDLNTCCYLNDAISAADVLSSGINPQEYYVAEQKV